MSAIDEIEKWQSVADRYLKLVEKLQVSVVEYRAIVRSHEELADKLNAKIEALRQERDGLRETNHALAGRLDELCRVRNERDGLLRAAKYLADFNHPDPDDEWLNSAAMIDAAMAKEQGDE